MPFRHHNQNEKIASFGNLNRLIRTPALRNPHLPGAHASAQGAGKAAGAAAPEET
jgi:hypothetical protein